MTERTVLTLLLLLSGICAYAENPGAENYLPVRELYGPAHFGNAYEVMSATGMSVYLAEYMDAKDANRFLDAQEMLYNDIYGLGRVDHVLNPAAGRPDWIRRSGQLKETAPKMLPEQ